MSEQSDTARQDDEVRIYAIPQEVQGAESGQKLDALLHTEAANENDRLTPEQLTILAKQWADNVYNIVDAEKITLQEALAFLQSRSPEFGVIYEDNFYDEDGEPVEDQAEVLAKAIERAVIEKVLTMKDARTTVFNGERKTVNEHFKLVEVNDLLVYATIPNSINESLLNGEIQIEDVFASLNGYLSVEDVWADGKMRHSPEGYNDVCRAIKERLLSGIIPIDYLQAQNTLRSVDIWQESADGYAYKLGRVKFGVLKEIERALDDDGPNASLSVGSEVKVGSYDIAGEVLNPEITYLIVGLRDEAYKCVQISDGKKTIWVAPRVIKEIVN